MANTKQQLKATVEYLLKYKCSNYGYDSSFKKIKAQRAYARKCVRNIISNFGVESLKWENVGSRLVISLQPEYIVGQSPNEEVTNVLRVLASIE